MDKIVGYSSRKALKERLLARRQTHGESLHAYINRYLEQALQVDDLNEEFRLFGITSGILRDSEFWWSF